MSVKQLVSQDLVPQEPFRPRVVMEGMKSTLSRVGLSNALLGIIFSYEYEISAKDLLGRIHFVLRVDPVAGGREALQVFFAYAKIEKLFNDLIGFGRDYDVLSHAEVCILQAAATEYRYVEETAPDTVTIDAQVTGPVAKIWPLRLSNKVNLDLDCALDPGSQVYGDPRQDGERDMYYRVETTNFRAPAEAPELVVGKLTLEQVVLYAPQVQNMVNVQKLLEELFKKHSEIPREGRVVKLYASEKVRVQLGEVVKEEIAFDPMQAEDPSVPKFVQECVATARESRWPVSRDEGECTVS